MIVTFYSYKGGVGRSMALANIADQLARSGMRVLMVDFDLEAPGLEHFFPINHERVRGREGLLDLLLAFKYAMSVASSDADEGESDAFRDLDRYLSTVYPRGSDGGCLDLLAAGLRLTDEQISRYGAELRRFDWQDFYYVWSGELFFEWFRRTCAERYDVVLVDSRTGVTELGGVCAYQLADVIVALSAPNLQNIEGTAWMVRHFLSEQVRAVRRDRPLEVLVVPARVDQNDTALLDAFADRFRLGFDPYTPAPLMEAGLTFWELQIPYESAYAFDEQVITDPGRAEERRGLAEAYASLRNAIALLAPDGNPLAALRPAATQSDPRPGGSGGPDGPGGPGGKTLVETRYDPTTRFASADVLLSYRSADRETAEEIRELLRADHLHVAEPLAGAVLTDYLRAKVSLVLVGSPGELGAYQLRELNVLAAREDTRLLPVLLPGAGRLPEELREYACLDFRQGLEAHRLLETVRAALRPPTQGPLEPSQTERNPYPGLAPFSEADADVFFGRDALVDEALDSLERHGMCAIVGGASSGKSSLVNAGVLPALRSGRLRDSHLWPIVTVHHPGDTEELLEALRSLVGPREDGTELGVEDLNETLSQHFRQVVVVLDQFEELLTQASTARRAGFIALLRKLTHDLDPVVLPITVLRTDFLGRAHEHAPFLVERHIVLVTPLSAEKLRKAVVMPARAAGLQLEPGLAERLMQDVGDEPGALPFLQFSLSTLWQRREDGYLTHRAYAESGRVHNSLASTAEELFASFSPADQGRARDLLLRLVSVDLDGQRLSRAIPTATLAETGTVEVCEQMVRQRLLVITADNKNGPCVQLAHYALMDAWPRFGRWIGEASSVLDLRQRLSAAAQEWEESGRDRSGLLGEQSLSSVAATGTDLSIALGSLETDYLARSQADARGTRRTRYLALALLSIFTVGSMIASLTVFKAEQALLAVLQFLVVLSYLAFFSRRRERRSLSPWTG